MEELLAAAAAALNAPEAMVERSAQARAQADGVSVEDVLTAWAGGDAIPAAAAPAAPEAPAADSAPAAPAAPAASSPPAVVDPSNQESLIAAAAVKMNMPESMIRRSAEARARAAETDVQSILLEWAGVDPDAPPPAAPAPVVESTPAVEAPAAEPAPAAPAPAAAGGGMDEAAILAAAAEKMGMSESMVQRSAGARAKAAGVEPSVILAEWAGVEAAAAPAAPTAPAAAAPPAPAPAAPTAPAPVAPAEPAASAAPEVLGGDDEPAGAASAPVDDEYEPEEMAVAAGALPRWLAALFVVVPAIAIGYALFFPNGPNCGDAGSLAIDPVTGLAVNCDGSEYGVEEVDLFSLGQEIYNGVGCAACHGSNGAGVANFPAFTGGALLTTFPQDWCSAQVEWITLGTTGWPEPTYGATEKPVGGSGAVMPGFEGTLSPEEIIAVTLYERVAFGGQDLAAAEADCAAVEEAMTSAMGG